MSGYLMGAGIMPAIMLLEDKRRAKEESMRQLKEVKAVKFWEDAGMKHGEAEAQAANKDNDDSPTTA